MFRKKRCKNCNEKINDSYNYCPYCRTPIDDFFDDSEDWGLLGKNDFDPHQEIKLPKGVDKLFRSLLKSLNKQVKNLEEPKGKKSRTLKGTKNKRSGIGISIHTSDGKPPEIRVTSFGNMPPKIKKKVRKKGEGKGPKLPSSKLKKFSGLPKEEPETEIRRLSDKVIYEIKMPGVKSVKDISISQLKNSIEIKALGKNKVFQKIIPINLPIKKYNFSKKKLTLELAAD